MFKLFFSILLVLSSLATGNYTLCVSNEIMLEYLEVFQMKFNATKSALVYDFLTNSDFVEDIEVYFQWNLIATDVDDNKFVDCAIAAGADYLVTEDSHFNQLKQVDFPKVNVIGIDAFIDILQNNTTA